MVTNEIIAEMIHNGKHGRNITEEVVPDPHDQPEELKKPRIFI